MFVNILLTHIGSISIYVLKLLLISTIVGVVAYKLFQWRRFQYWKKRNVEQLPPRFPSGNFHEVLFQKTSIGEFLEKLYNSSKSDVLGFYIFHTPQLLVRSPEVVKQVLVSDFGHFHDRIVASDERADPLASKLLLTVKNPEWKIMRQKVTPIFTTSKIRAMSEHVMKSTEDLLDYLDGTHRSGPIEAKELCAKFTTDVITSCAFGVQAHCFVDEDAPFRDAGRRLIDTTFMNGVRFMIYFLIPSIVGPLRIPFFDPKAMHFLRDAFLETIGLREANKQQKRGDLIDIIIELKKHKELPEGIMFEGDRVVAQAIQFFGAGFETTSATISFALYELALNEHIQTTLRQTVVKLIESGETLSYDSVLKLTYVERVILETLRKYPSLPFLDRRCNKDFTIPNTNITIEKGTAVYIPMLGIHYDEEYFPDAQKFDPDRFLSENVKTRHPFTYLPFGQGPHNCLGERFAMNAVKLCLSQLLLKYKVLPCADTPKPIEFSPKSFPLIPTNGIPLVFKKL